jgi:hypothetical protein
MAFETHGPAAAEVQSASDIYVLQVVWRTKRDATLPHYVEKRESCCSLTEPNRSKSFTHFQPIIFYVEITPDSQIRLQATQRFLQRRRVGVEECLSVVFRHRSERAGLDD